MTFGEMKFTQSFPSLAVQFFQQTIIIFRFSVFKEEWCKKKDDPMQQEMKIID